VHVLMKNQESILRLLLLVSLILIIIVVMQCFMWFTLLIKAF
jgi:hypothetical protein